MSIHGTSGNDTLTGTSGNDTFDVSQGGNDTVSGLAGNDIVSFGATFTAADSVDGGAGTDTIRLAGDYTGANAVVMGDSTMQNVEQIQLAAGNSYNLTTSDGNVAAGNQLKIDAHTLGASDTLTFNGAAEGDGKFYVVGGAGNDSVIGGGGQDLFDLSLGGNDRVSGLGGFDTFKMGTALTASDRIDGGAGNDVVILTGDYSGSHAVVFTPTTMVNVEFIRMSAGFSYDLTTDDATVASGKTLTVDASLLGAGNSLTFDGATESNGHFDIIGGAGNDFIVGSSSNSFPTGDTIDLSKGGNDIAETQNGVNTFLMGAALNAGDTISGDGSDTIVLNGDYSAGLVFGSNTMSGVAVMELTGGNGYNLTLSNANVTGGLLVDATTLGTGDSLTFNASALTHGGIDLESGAGTNHISGGAGADAIGIDNPAASATISGGAGADTIFAGTTILSDTIDGGTGTDEVNIDPGTYALTAGILTSVEILNLIPNGGAAASQIFDITENDANVPAGQNLRVDATSLPGDGATVTFDGSAETDGSFTFRGGAATDTLIGGANADTFLLQESAPGTFTGGGGADVFTLTGAVGAIHTFAYNAVSDSTSTAHDTITGVNLQRDVFHVSPIGTVTGVDTAVTTGSLSNATFDSDLASDIGAAQLAAGHAVMFTANAGDLSGHTFIVVDENGVAGYQAGQDLVIDITGFRVNIHIPATEHLALSNFS